MKNTTVTVNAFVEALIEKNNHDNSIPLAYARTLGNIQGMIECYLTNNPESPLHEMINNKMVSLQQEVA
jgi:hypothetical protein